MEPGQGHKEMLILGYHKIGSPSPGGWETWFYIPEEIFSSHLACIRDSGWMVLDAEQLVVGLRDSALLPEQSVVITFDDGYRSLLTTTVPLLQEFGFPAVVFVPTNFIGGMNDFDLGIEPGEPICTWEELAELLEAHVSVQSHGTSHRAFSQLSRDEILAEVTDSKASLDQHLGTRVELFSFPFGDVGASPDETTALLLRAGYEGACLYAGGMNRSPVDPFHLQRLAMGPETDLHTILRSSPSLPNDHVFA